MENANKPFGTYQTLGTHVVVVELGNHVGISAFESAAAGRWTIT